MYLLIYDSKSGCLELRLKMKILFITEKIPYPLDSGGKIRTYHILKGLSQDHDVTLITTAEHEDQKKYIKQLNKYVTM